MTAGRDHAIARDGAPNPPSLRSGGDRETGCVFELQDGTTAILLGRTATGRYAYAVPSVLRADGTRPVVRTMSAPQADIVLGRGGAPSRPSRDRRGAWTRE